MTIQPHHAHLDAMQASVDTARLDAGEITLAEWARRGERRLLVAAGAVREDRPRDATAELLREIRSRLPAAVTESSGGGRAEIRYVMREEARQ